MSERLDLQNRIAELESDIAEGQGEIEDIAEALNASRLRGLGPLLTIEVEDQLNVLCGVLQQIKASDRHVGVTWNGESHCIKLTYGNEVEARLEGGG